MKKILIISDFSYKPVKMFIDQSNKLAKGFIRLGHDVRCIYYNNILQQLSMFKSKKLTSFFYKKNADEILAGFVKNYQPDIIVIGLPRNFDGASVNLLRDVAPQATLIGGDGDPWPKANPGRIETAKHLDILTSTNDGSWLQEYRDAGVPFCVFMSNFCDSDTDHRYKVGSEWESDIIWTGKAKHHACSHETIREELVEKISRWENCAIYGCLGRPNIGGMDILYAVSGARIGLSISATEPVKLYDSDRLIRLLSCGTFVLARRFPDCELLFKDGEHIRYFDTVDEFFELADWYLQHENERKRIADAGMERTHKQFNCTNIAGYLLELVEKRKYSAPWFEHLSTAKLGR